MNTFRTTTPTDQPTDQPTNQPTDTASSSVACPRLKIRKRESWKFQLSLHRKLYLSLNRGHLNLCHCRWYICIPTLVMISGSRCVWGVWKFDGSLAVTAGDEPLSTITCEQRQFLVIDLLIVVGRTTCLPKGVNLKCLYDYISCDTLLKSMNGTRRRAS